MSFGEEEEYRLEHEGNPKKGKVGGGWGSRGKMGVGEINRWNLGRLG